MDTMNGSWGQIKAVCLAFRDFTAFQEEYIEILQIVRLDLCQLFFTQVGFDMVADIPPVSLQGMLAYRACHTFIQPLIQPFHKGRLTCLCQFYTTVDKDALVDRNIPLHLNRFFLRYQMTDKPPTSVERVYRLADVAREYLAFVYTGNC